MNRPLPSRTQPVIALSVFLVVFAFIGAPEVFGFDTPFGRAVMYLLKFISIP